MRAICYVFSYLFYLAGHIICHFPILNNFSIFYRLYSFLMKISIGLDKEGRIWKYSNSKTKD
jgi:hypothetical protein